MTTHARLICISNLNVLIQAVNDLCSVYAPLYYHIRINSLAGYNTIQQCSLKALCSCKVSGIHYINSTQMFLKELGYRKRIYSILHTSIKLPDFELSECSVLRQ